MFFNKEKQMAIMQMTNRCPDCKGKGIHYFVGAEYFVGAPMNCPSCNGTGLYTEWENSIG